VAVAILGLISCNKEMTFNGDDSTSQMRAPGMQKEEMIPVAQLTGKGAVELLFLQSDVQNIMQKLFDKTNPDLKLVFVDVEIQNPKTNEAGLLFQISNAKKGVRETTIVMALTLDAGIYYLPKEYDGTRSDSRAIACYTNCSKPSESGSFASGCKPTETYAGSNVWFCSQMNCTGNDPKGFPYVCSTKPVIGGELSVCCFEELLPIEDPPVGSEDKPHKVVEFMPQFTVANYIFMWLFNNAEPSA